jgi:hypothetical protein
MPAIKERPLLDSFLEPLAEAFYTLSGAGDFSIPALSKVYELTGFFDELAFYEIMLDTHHALEQEQAKEWQKK